jgi:hemolysin activation/secretion protein
MKNKANVWLAMVASGASSMPALAQHVPPSVEPGRVEERLRQPLPPEPSRGTSPSLATPRIESNTPPSNANEVRIDLKALVIEGATAYPVNDLIAPYAQLIGYNVTLAQIYTIADELTARYRNDGYVLTTVVVPVQTIAAGRVRLQVVEGHLSRVEFLGDASGRTGMLKDIERRLTAERPLRNATLERELLLLNDLPGLVAQAVLQPGDATGGSLLTINLAQSAFTANLGVTNRGSEVQGPVQYEAGIDLSSLFSLSESTSLRYLQSSEREELWLASLAHTQRVTSGGLDLTLAGSVSRSSPELGPELANLNLETDTDQASIQVAYPLMRSRTGNLRTRMALTYHDGLSDSDFGAISRDVISAVRLGVSFDSVDAWRGVNLLDMEFSHGLSVFGSSEFGDELASRVGGNPKFSKATLYLARLQGLGSRWSVLLAASGQAAFSNLLAPEEFAFGGEFYGRAYDPSEVVGDSGAAGKVELRYTIDHPGGLGLTVYGFYEAGTVWRRLDASEVGAEDEESANSAGGGLRMTFGPHVSGYVEGAAPLNRIVAAEGSDDARIFGGVKVSFGQ